MTDDDTTALTCPDCKGSGMVGIGVEGSHAAMIRPAASIGGMRRCKACGGSGTGFGSRQVETRAHSEKKAPPGIALAILMLVGLLVFVGLVMAVARLLRG